VTTDVRVRFAPSPTGYLHVGGARTALFNWLFARGRGGTFVLRIEDTDQERSSIESSREILSGLQWLGLNWDEGPEVGGAYGPYFQSDRKAIYQEAIDRLLKSERAYYCFCTAEELEERRTNAIAKGLPAQYDRRCRRLSSSEATALVSTGNPAVVRIAMETGESSFSDLVHGDLNFGAEHLDDFVIQRTDGFPTYNFAVVVDDASMRITHVIRGDDHLSNTPKQIELYKALGFEPPQFAHLPLILGQDGTRLSKRHGATSVAWYEQQGYLPGAMVNYLALLGWSPGEDRERLSVDELCSLFSLERVGAKAAVFDMEKFSWMNGQYMKEAPLSKKVELVRQSMARDGKQSVVSEATNLESIVALMGDRLRVASQFPSLAGYILYDDFEFDDVAVEKHFSTPGASDRLEQLATVFERIEEFSAEHTETALRDLAKELAVKPASLIHPARVAVSGRTEGPGVFELFEVLGRERTVVRLRDAVTIMRKRFPEPK
jgi:glutamyl-tRNA synthetase